MEQQLSRTSIEVEGERAKERTGLVHRVESRGALHGIKSIGSVHQDGDRNVRVRPRSLEGTSSMLNTAGQASGKLASATGLEDRRLNHRSHTLRQKATQGLTNSNGPDATRGLEGGNQAAGKKGAKRLLLGAGGLSQKTAEIGDSLAGPGSLLR